ncbi:hypothetical protein K9U33_04660 [Rhodoblastus acidophilus]|uniref:Uncharacterized protein n=1 Tax=Candidatus Rhodoblastus alkanivorans TaxID=2954117 RepID=A0ABS9ZB32_9HYPH|nr:hypothetical protein [Candidatus Rhodoblastus alkanivorans]MCI4677947.1 hypothetical protein [Candidatus Rhodoblastus alkanivorans]MCI4683842.1 hypothetical protein [Candidatus Rhodoblastus alkanivorans]
MERLAALPEILSNALSPTLIFGAAIVRGQGLAGRGSGGGEARRRRLGRASERAALKAEVAASFKGSRPHVFEVPIAPDIPPLI